MWNLRNKTDEQRGKKERIKSRNRLNSREETVVTREEVGGGWVK